jgi:4-amino-4-deoxy-L-arabinose transferase-like glycosyltransferase
MPATSRAPRFGPMLGLLALLALAIRENYVFGTLVDVPIQGDIREYVACAWNLVAHGVFSSTFPPHPPVADSFRFPGYPWLIALGMRLFPQDPSWSPIGAWVPFVIQVQVLLGTATCVLVALLAREWLKPAWAIVAGMVLALWPHHIAASDTMLSEVLFGFTLVAGLYAFARAARDGRWHWAAAAGAALGYAFLVNPLILLFPPALALWWWLRLGRRRAAAVLLGVFLVPVVGMWVRNAGLDPAQAHGSRQRAALNFVQGSWPNYHAAANHRGDPVATAIMQEIGAETRELQASPRAGLARIGRRMAGDPAFHAEWYLAKPWLLWGWQIRLGATDINVLPVANTPLERNPLLRGIVAGYRIANPVLTTIMLLCALTLFVAGLRRRIALPAFATATLALYLTAVHEVLQAEPRYATAYRGIEAVLLATALAWIVGIALRTRNGPRGQT